MTFASKVGLAVGRWTPGGMTTTTNSPVGGGSVQGLDREGHLLRIPGLEDAGRAHPGIERVVVCLAGLIRGRVWPEDIEASGLKDTTLQDRSGCCCGREEQGRAWEQLHGRTVSSLVMLRAWHDTAAAGYTNRSASKRKDFMM